MEKSVHASVSIVKRVTKFSSAGVLKSADGRLDFKRPLTSSLFAASNPPSDCLPESAIRRAGFVLPGGYIEFSRKPLGLAAGERLACVRPQSRALACGSRLNVIAVIRDAP